MWLQALELDINLSSPMIHKWLIIAWDISSHNTSRVGNHARVNFLEGNHPHIRSVMSTVVDLHRA